MFVKKTYDAKIILTYDTDEEEGVSAVGEDLDTLVALSVEMHLNSLPPIEDSCLGAVPPVAVRVHLGGLTGGGLKKG